MGILCPVERQSIEILLKSFETLDFENACILINEIGQLYDFTREIPEIAWDIVEFENNALVIEYPHFNENVRKILPNGFKPRIMLVKEHPLYKSLHSFGKGLIFLYHLNPEIIDQNLPSLEYVLNLNSSAFDLFNPKVIQLKMNGEIKFL